MKNVLKLIIDAIKIAISKISWNDLNDKPFYEEVNKNTIVPELTLENFEAMIDTIYCVANQFTMTPIVGDTYIVNWDGDSYEAIAKDFDGLICIGNENYINMTSGGKIPFAIIFTDTDIFVAIESTETSYTEETHTISIFTTQTNIKKIDEKYLPEIGVKSWDDLEDRPFGTEISKINLIEEQTITLDGSGSGNCISIDGYYEYTAVGTPYEIEFDGEIYTGTMYEDGDVSIRTDFTTSSGINVYMYDCSGIYSSSTLAGEHTIKLSVIGEKVNQIDDIYIPDTIARTQDLETKMDKNNPSGTGSLSIGRQPNTLTGLYSQAIGNGVMATSKSQHAIGEFNDVTNDKYVQEVENKKSVEIPSTRTIYISDNYTFDANTGVYALVEPCSGLASNYRTLISQNGLTGKPVYIMGSTTTSSRMYSSPGSVTVAVGSLYLYTVDMYTSLYAPGARGKYAHVVGNGISDTARSNAHTLDWDGNAWYQGTIKLGGTSYNDASEVALKSDVENKKNKDIVLTLSWTTAEDGTRTYSVDKTFEEIKEAYNSGTSLYINTSGIKFECTNISNKNALFKYYLPHGMIEHNIAVNSDNTVTWTSTTRSAKSNIYGGVKADTKSDTDTVPAKIGEDGKLYVPSYPTLNGLASEDYVSDQIDLVEQDINALSTEIKNIDIPSNVSDLNNDSGFITRTVQNLANYYLKSETYSQDEVNAKLSAIPKFAIQPVDTLPTSNISVTTVYLLKSGEESQNLYTEYIYVNNTWEYLGAQTVDLSGYALKSDVPIKLSELTNDSGFITKNVTDLVNYYKKTEVYSKNEIDAKKYLTEHQDLSAYAKTSQIPTKVSQLTNDSKFLTAIPNEYVTESELEGKGYLTQHQDLSFYAKKSTTLAGYGITDAATKTELTKLDNEKIGHTELTNEVASALQTAKDSGTFDGQDGDDGVSCTHSWNGTTLTITSASGSSSANLKGDKGDKGDKGVSGVYVGSGSMPSGYNIQIDPEGDADYGDLVTREEFDRLEKTKVDQNKVATYVTPEMYGAKGDGKTDDSTAIQQAIDGAGSGNIVYLGKKTYLIGTGLLLTHSNRHFVCKGKLSYTGTGSAITIGSKNIQVDVNEINAPNGTAVHVGYASKYVEYNIVNVNNISSSKIGLHLFTDTVAMQYNRFNIGFINATDIAVYVQAEASFINENYYYLGKITGCDIGVKLYSAITLSSKDGFGTNDNHFFSGSFEGITNTAIHIDNSCGNKFNNLRCQESYGEKSIVLVNYCKNNDFKLSRIFTKEIDISGLTGGNHNILQSTLVGDILGGRSLGTEARIDSLYGITYNPINLNQEVVVKGNTFSDNVIKQKDTIIPTSLYFTETEINNSEFKLSDIYSAYLSMARGFPITATFGETGGRVLLKDSLGTVILDNTNGEYATKTVSVRWNGYDKTNNKNIWDVQILGGSFTNVPTKTSQLENDSGFITKEDIPEAQVPDLSGYAKTADHYTKTESDNKYQPKGNYLTQHQDISGKVDKSEKLTMVGIDADGNSHTWIIYGEVVS